VVSGQIGSPQIYERLKLDAFSSLFNPLFKFSSRLLDQKVIDSLICLDLGHELLYIKAQLVNHLYHVGLHALGFG
jgi:hypothetical protein